MELKPYVGNEPYLYFCFCPEDAERARELIAGLIERGCRVAFDMVATTDGEQNRSEWLGQAAACAFLFSERSVRHHSFRRELTNAIFAGKPVAAIMTEKTMLTYGINLQLESALRFNKYVLGEEEFYEAFLGSRMIFPCIGPLPVKEKTFFLTQMNTGRVIPLREGRTRIGRMQNECDVVIENKYVGRCHAILNVSKRSCLVQDNHSKNKTFINSIELSPDKVYGLNDGDRISFANEIFLFSCREDQGVLS